VCVSHTKREENKIVLQLKKFADVLLTGNSKKNTAHSFKFLLFLAGRRGHCEEGRLFEERRLLQISCSREALNRRGALIRSKTVFIFYFLIRVILHECDPIRFEAIQGMLSSTSSIQFHSISKHTLKQEPCLKGVWVLVEGTQSKVFFKDK